MVNKTSVLPKGAVALPGMANSQRKVKNSKTEHVVADALPKDNKSSFEGLKELKNLKVLNGKGLKDRVYYKKGKGFWVEKKSNGFVEFLKAIFLVNFFRCTLLGYTSNDKKVFNGLDEAVTKDLSTLASQAKTSEEMQELVETLQTTDKIFEDIRSEYENKGETRNQRAIEKLQSVINDFVTQNTSSPLRPAAPKPRQPVSVPASGFVSPPVTHPAAPAVVPAVPVDAGGPPPPPGGVSGAGGPPPPPPPELKRTLSAEERRQKAAAEKAQKIADTQEALSAKESEHAKFVEIESDIKARGKRLVAKSRILRNEINLFSRVLENNAKYTQLSRQEDTIHFRIAQLKDSISKLAEEIEADTEILRDIEATLSENPEQQEFQIETETGTQTRSREDLENFVRNGEVELQELAEEKQTQEEELDAKEAEMKQLAASDDWNTEVTVKTEESEQTFTLKELHELVKSKKEKQEKIKTKIVLNNSELEVTTKSKDQLDRVIHGLKTTLASLSAGDAPEPIEEKKEVDRKGMAGAAMATLNRMQSKKKLGFGTFKRKKAQVGSQV